MAYEELTFNELPSAVTLLLQKVDDLEHLLHQLQGDLTQKKKSEENGHIPMSLTEACAFLKMKRSTMYYHLENGNIPATRKGKNYILFKDELVRWAESGRTNDVPMTISEREEAISNGIRRHKFVR
jgi:excisionase family DNA binding protein